MKRKIIQIDEEKCTGCGLCVPECKEGALQIIEGKARLISDLFCDGLGACIGYCPEDAITIVEKEAEPYDERSVIESLAQKPIAVVEAHLKHLIEHNEIDLYNQAVERLKELGIANSVKLNKQTPAHTAACGCMGSAEKEIKKHSDNNNSGSVVSELRQWPIQLHLVNPLAQYFKGSSLTILSTCSPIAYGNIQKDYVAGNALAIACPKLDYTAPYAQKLAEIFAKGNTPKVTVVLMEVPCCKGLSKIAQDARQQSGRSDLIIEEHVISLDGKLISVNRI